MLGSHYSSLKFPWILQLRPGFGAEAWAGPAASPPLSGLGLTLPNGVSGASGLWAGWLAGCPGADLFPPGSPAARIPVYSPGAVSRGLQAGCWENFIGTSIEMRAMGVLKAFRSCFIGASLPDTLGSSDFQGNLVSLLGLHPVSSRFGLAAPRLAYFDPHLVLGLHGLSDEEVRGHHFRTATGTQIVPCV